MTEEQKPEMLYFGELRFNDEAKINVARAMDKRYIAAADTEVAQYQEEWGKLFGYKHNVAMYSGTGADTVACKTLYDVHPRTKRSLHLEDNEIIAPANAFIAVGSSIVDAGFMPVFVDIERETLNINPGKIEEKVTDKTRAIMAVHTMGKPCEMDTIIDIARRHELLVIEDSCEAHAAKFKDKYIGHWGDMATFSSYVAHLICSTEGGMLSTNNETIGEIAASLRNHGRKVGSMYFDHVRLGGNYKMHDLEAAVGRAAIGKFWETFHIRKNNIYWMMNATKDLQEYAHMNVEGKHEIICPHAYTVTIRDPKQFSYRALYDYMYDNPILHIAAKRNFGSIPTQHKAFEFLGRTLGEFPEAEYVGDNGLHFGLHQYTTQDQLERASEVLHTFFSKFKK
ncbi:MAG TPA: DegT/DnrJ/EryC1/StrS family aminotransferase [Candidatus Nanoarchaeia archaeon]|nr:DegT/DnrJ/EryC1/StrS family aminotransferase [Candidatus Nanoarchaeia archaeon]